MFGRTGDDTFLYGGRDTIFAGDDNDILTALGSAQLGATLTLGSGNDDIRTVYKPTAFDSHWYRGGGETTVTDFVQGEDKIGLLLFQRNPVFGDGTASDDGINVGFASLDTNDDNVLNGADQDISFDGGMVINLGAGLREATPYDVAIGQAMLLKLDGITELTAADFNY